jgi:2-dehydro-3-deoxy-D-arabinonate dehydratase
MHLYRTKAGVVAESNGDLFSLKQDWNELVNNESLFEFITSEIGSLTADERLAAFVKAPLKPLIDQEIWAAGVTYFRSMTARMEESQEAGGGDFYDRVYAAERPEIFFKATASRCVGTGEAMKLRSDSKWIVPEPELVLAITRTGKIVGYSVGNDLSCRDIEGENPLYLPQAKTFDRCAAVGPGIFVSPTPLSKETEIRLSIRRNGSEVVSDSTSLAQMKRGLEELVEFLFRDNAHPHGCLLMTGTGIVPPDDFTLQPGDEVEISIGEIGTLVNSMD